MKTSIKATAIGIVFTILAGTLLHFIYELSGKSIIAGVFGAVNESTWEHLKLLFIPFVFFCFIEFFVYGKNYGNYIIASALAVLAGMAAIIILFYTYTGVIGSNLMAADIVIFIFSVLFAFYVRNKIINKNLLNDSTSKLAGTIILLMLAASFVIFTFYPPQIALFKDPLTLTYGIFNYKPQ